VLSPLASALRLASFVLCLIVVARFTLFVIDQTSSASAHQQALVNNDTTTQATPANGSASSKDSGKGTARKTLDETSEAVTSPFSFATESTSSQWLAHGIDLVLTLLVYGFGLAFLARMIRVRL
jgi:hypothetical protein